MAEEINTPIDFLILDIQELQKQIEAFRTICPAAAQTAQPKEDPQHD